MLIADDQALVRAGFAVLVSRAADMEVVGEAGTGTEAVAAGRQLLPDVVLMDVRMPLLGGIEATRQLLSDPTTANVRVIMLTTFDLDEYVYAALQAGASGFLLKDTPPELLLAGIRTVAAGEALLAPSITRRLIREILSRPNMAARVPSPALSSLTEREKQVLMQVASGLPNGDIARQLTISIATVKTHVSRLLTKLDAHDRAQLVVIAYESGLVEQSRS